MSRLARTWFPIAIVAGALAGCSSSKQLELDPNIFPAKYKEEILSTLTQMLVDSSNVRDAYISDPAFSTVDKEQRYTACVRYNARNISRQYEGSKDRIAFFYGGHLNQFIPASKEQCGNAAYKPFPELEKLCLAKKCE